MKMSLGQLSLNFIGPKIWNLFRLIHLQNNT